MEMNEMEETMEKLFYITSHDADLLERLAIDWGYENSWEMIEENHIDSVVPAICTNEDCDMCGGECQYSTEMEPDQAEGWCECCDKNTVVSCLVLAEIV